MKHVVLIDDETPEGAELIESIRKLPKEAAEFFDDDAIDDCITVGEWGEQFLSELEKAYKEKESSK